MKRIRLVKRLIPLAVVASFVLAFFALGLNRYLTVETLRVNETWLHGTVAAHPLLAPIIFALAYTGVVAFSLPGGAVMTIGGGFLFGLTIGALLSVLSATTGAVILFLLARFVVGDALRARAGPFLVRMAEGFERNAFNYLLFLRLVPLFPFWAVNLAPALLGIPLRSFAVATLIGIIPGSLAYAAIGDGLGLAANAGANGQGGSVNLTTIALRVGFALLALAPIALQWLRRRQPRRV